MSWYGVVLWRLFQVVSGAAGKMRTQEAPQLPRRAPGNGPQ
jgi:hypothetical protein